MIRNKKKYILILILIIGSIALNAQKLKPLEYKISGMTIAVNDMDNMLNFYSNVFDIEFTTEELYGTKLYSGTWGNLNLLLCPASIAKNTAKQNKHQFDVIVSDLSEIIKLTTIYGGKLMGEVAKDKYSSSIGIYDPDKNSIIFKQLKKAEF